MRNKFLRLCALLSALLLLLTACGEYNPAVKDPGGHGHETEAGTEEEVVTDAEGNQVGQKIAFCKRQTKKDVITFPMVNFETEESFNTLGELDLATLKPGTYHCTHVLTDAHGGEHTMRDFDFTVE